MRTISLAIGATLAASAAFASNNPDQDAIDVCIDHLLGLGGPQGGEVLSSSFSEAGTEVYLLSGDGTVFRCIAYRDGTVGDFAAQEGADPDALRASGSIEQYQERVQFDAGTSGATLSRTLEAGGASQFILGARDGQFLDVALQPLNGKMYYIIRNPDGSILLEGTDAATPYRGQLWQSGDHIVEVVNQESQEVDFNLSVTIE
jgi:hypothetical protein